MHTIGAWRSLEETRSFIHSSQHVTDCAGLPPGPIYPTFNTRRHWRPPQTGWSSPGSGNTWWLGRRTGGNWLPPSSRRYLVLLTVMASSPASSTCTIRRLTFPNLGHGQILTCPGRGVLISGRPDKAGTKRGKEAAGVAPSPGLGVLICPPSWNPQHFTRVLGTHCFLCTGFSL